jgi:predicted ferric reductase
VSPQVWWYVARASGLVAYGLVTLSVAGGLLLSTRVLGRNLAPEWVLDLHRYMGGLALTFTAVHLGGLLLDDYVEFAPVDLLVPFAAEWRPGALAWGIVGLYLLLAVQLTSLVRERLPRALWRRIHLASFPLFGLATVHTLTAGSDARHPGVLVLVGGACGLVVLLALARLLPPRKGRPAAEPLPTPRAGS